MIEFFNWPRGLAHERAENLKLEGQGVVLWFFSNRMGWPIYMARLPSGAIIHSDTDDQPAHALPERSFMARSAVRERARAELGKTRTPAHVIFFSKLDQKRDQP